MHARYASDPSWGHEEVFSWKECLKAFMDPKWYAFFAYQFSINISLYGLTTFMPAIVRGLGYTSVIANLMTVPIFFCALVFFLILANLSDRTGVRGPFLATGLVCLIIGYSLLISVENLKVRFFACFGKSYSPRKLEHVSNSPFSRSFGNLSDHRAVAHVAAGQRVQTLQASNHGRLYLDSRKYCWCCRGADFHNPKRAEIHPWALNCFGTGLLCVA